VKNVIVPSWAEVVASSGGTTHISEPANPSSKPMISQGDSVDVLMRESVVLKTTGRAHRLRGVQRFTFDNRMIKKIDEIADAIRKVPDSGHAAD
jgi:hypothetical protein